MYFSCILVCLLLHLFPVTVLVCIYLFSDMTYNVNSKILKFSGKVLIKNWKFYRVIIILYIMIITGYKKLITIIIVQ